MCERGYFIYSLFVWCCPHTVKAGQWLDTKLPALWLGEVRGSRKREKEGKGEIQKEGEKDGIRKGNN